tara:strand:- start:4355 stop:4540 length:186 start_codon:yes stop_codon:yes gene_type:complete
MSPIVFLDVSDLEALEDNLDHCEVELAHYQNQLRLANKEIKRLNARLLKYEKNAKSKKRYR